SLENRVKDRGCALLLMPNYDFLQSSEAEFFIAVLPVNNTVAVHHQDRARPETRGSSREFDVRHRAENHTRWLEVLDRRSMNQNRRRMSGIHVIHGSTIASGKRRIESLK